MPSISGFGRNISKAIGSLFYELKGGRLPMRAIYNLCLKVVCLTVSLITVSTCMAQQKPSPALVKNFGKPPLSFEKNIGQTNKQVKFLSRGNGYSLFLTPKEAVFNLTQRDKQSGTTLRMQLLGANANAKETAEAKL